MSLELVIKVTETGNEIALLKEGVLTELHREHGTSGFNVGDVFLGKVKRTIPQLNAAFVDVGHEKDAFLHYLDLGPQFASLKDFSDKVMSGAYSSKDLSSFKGLPDIDKNGKIKDRLSGGQVIPVQIAKEPISAKGPRLTSEITIAGRYLVLVPFNKKISLSQKIKTDEERERLKNLIASIKPENFGVIVRTVAEGKKVAELDADLRDLAERWEKLVGRLKTAKPPHRLLGELNRTSTILRDLLNPNFSAIHVSDENTAKEVKAYLRNIAPDREGIVKLHKTNDIFEDFKIYRQIKASFGRQVNLKSGAYLIIEHTEAMHVIDVNSGNRKGGATGQEDNAVKTNVECAKEIARILRLRDMGGIICIDFIDMGDKVHQKMLYDALKEAMADDKAKHSILPPSKFGVVEITRQRVRPATDIVTSEQCPSCNGTGKIGATILVTDEIENALRLIAEETGQKQVQLMVHPMLEAYLTKGWFWSSIAAKWKKRFNVKLDVVASSGIGLMEYRFFDKNGEELNV